MFRSLTAQLFASAVAVAVALAVFQAASIAPSSPSSPTFEWDRAFGDASTDWRTSVSGLSETAGAWRDRRAKMEADMRVLEEYLTGVNQSR